jgi:ABC-2 type transport system ATP-binding protein
MKDVNSADLIMENVSKTYRGKTEVQALIDLNLKVFEAETFGLLGPNGAGKTTAVGIATTRVRADKGNVIVAGVDVISNCALAKSRIGTVTQFNTLDRALNVKENIYYHCRYYAMSRVQAKLRTEELLETFNLKDKQKAMPLELSGGLAQRVQIARALAHRPQVLFLDEPSAGLDPQSRLALWDLIKTLKKEGVTIILTTHYMEEADTLCDRVAIIDHGKLLALDTPSNLKHSVDANTIIELQLSRAENDLIKKLENIPGVTKAEINSYSVTIYSKGSEESIPAIAKLALQNGLSDMSITEPTLETVFIQLTGRQLRD